MNVSDKLTENIRLYLNDLEDYGTHTDMVLVESTLNSFKQVILESNHNKQIIQEAINNSPSDKKKIIDDFMIYVYEM